MDPTAAALGREAYFSTAMRAAAAGDKQAYHELLVTARVILTAYGRRVLMRMGIYDEASLEDLVQEILMAIHLKRHTYDTAQPFLPWFFTIARYKLIDFGRREKRRPPGVPYGDVEEALGAPVFQDAATASDLATLMQSLPPRARSAVELVKLEGLSVAEAAGQLAMSETALKVSIHRSLKGLRERWQKEGGT